MNDSIKYCKKIYVSDNYFPVITIEKLKNLEQVWPLKVKYDENIFLKMQNCIKIRVLCS